MSTAPPDWDLLIVANDEDSLNHSWFPGKTRTVIEYTALEGMRFRNVYLTSMAIEKGSEVLFSILYRSAKCVRPMGKVLHVSDFPWEEA